MTEAGNFPNLIVIGAMKAGTTSLHYYLNLHPEISMSFKKELDFFFDKNFGRGLEWYKSQFISPKNVGEIKIYGESSPNYTNYPHKKGIPQRIFEVIPDVKLIYIVRDPIERIISHYLHLYSEGRETRSIEEALANLDNNKYISRSKYFLQLEQYLKFFSASNILIITSEELLKLTEETMKKVFLFLNVDSEIVSKLNFQEKKHQTSKKIIRKKRLMTTSLSSNTSYAFVIQKILNKIERSLYGLFSKKVERVTIDDELRKKILIYLSEDIAKLKEYTKSEFIDWNLQ